MGQNSNAQSASSKGGRLHWTEDSSISVITLLCLSFKAWDVLSCNSRCQTCNSFCEIQFITCISQTVNITCMSLRFRERYSHKHPLCHICTVKACYIDHGMQNMVSWNANVLLKLFIIEGCGTYPVINSLSKIVIIASPVSHLACTCASITAWPSVLSFSFYSNRWMFCVSIPRTYPTSFLQFSRIYQKRLTSPKTLSITGQVIFKSCLPWSGLPRPDYAELGKAIM